MVYQMQDHSTIKNKIFAFYQTTSDQEKKGVKPDLTFGYYDQEKYKGEMNWYSIAKERKFRESVKLDDILINGKSSGIC